MDIVADAFFPFLLQERFHDQQNHDRTKDKLAESAIGFVLIPEQWNDRIADAHDDAADDDREDRLLVEDLAPGKIREQDLDADRDDRHQDQGLQEETQN